jgi:hypothetical protein
MGKGQSGTSKHKQRPKKGPALKCGDCDTYNELKKRKTNKQERDHVPAFSSMFEKATAGKKFSTKQLNCIENKLKGQALTIAIPKGIHTDHSRTCKGRGGQKRLEKDVKNLKQAAEDDIDALKDKVPPGCRAAYMKAAKRVKAQNHNALINRIVKQCTTPGG